MSDGNGSPPLVEARGVTRILAGAVPVTLVRDIDLAVRPGEFVAITGPSGSGKSSLLYLLGLLDEPTSGEILIEGRPTAALSRRERARLRLEKLGFVFQFHFLLPEFSVLGNILIPMRKRGGRAEAEMHRRALEILDGLGMAAAERKLPDQLSGGERQRIAIARALANDPRLILADEPTGNLDTRNSGIVYDIFARLVADGRRSVVAVTHDLDLAARAHRRLHLVDGRIVSDGPPPAGEEMRPPVNPSAGLFDGAI
jgi:lipoprotein-releasing system ATP-binding protein